MFKIYFRTRNQNCRKCPIRFRAPKRKSLRFSDPRDTLYTHTLTHARTYVGRGHTGPHRAPLSVEKTIYIHRTVKYKQNVQFRSRIKNNNGRGRPRGLRGNGKRGKN